MNLPFYALETNGIISREETCISRECIQETGRIRAKNEVIVFIWREGRRKGRRVWARSLRSQSLSLSLSLSFIGSLLPDWTVVKLEVPIGWCLLLIPGTNLGIESVSVTRFIKSLHVKSSVGNKDLETRRVLRFTKFGEVGFAWTPLVFSLLIHNFKHSANFSSSSSSFFFLPSALKSANGPKIRDLWRYASIQLFLYRTSTHFQFDLSRLVAIPDSWQWSKYAEFPRIPILLSLSLSISLYLSLRCWS